MVTVYSGQHRYSYSSSCSAVEVPSSNPGRARSLLFWVCENSVPKYSKAQSLHCCPVCLHCKAPLISFHKGMAFLARVGLLQWHFPLFRGKNWYHPVTKLVSCAAPLYFAVFTLPAVLHCVALFGICRVHIASSVALRRIWYLPCSRCQQRCVVPLLVFARFT